MEVPVCMYHGTPEECDKFRRTVMALPHKHEKVPFKKPPPTKKRRLSRRNHGSDSDEEIDVLIKSEGEGGVVETNAQDDNDANPTAQLTSFPVVITTYEMVIKDRVHLAKYD